MVKKEAKQYTFKEFNKDLNELYDSLIEQKYDDTEVRKLFKPVLYGQSQFDPFIKILISVIIIIASIYYLSFIETVSWHLSAVGRILMIKILPYWDWTYLKDSTCLIKFPESTKKEVFNCGMCEHLNLVGVEYSNISVDTLMEKYLDVQFPVVIKDGLDHWNLDESFIDDVYNDDIIFDSKPCLLSSSLHSDSKNVVGQLIEKAKKLDKFYMHFQNCDYEPMRVFRKYSNRPQFLPSFLSPVTYNWIIWNKDYNTTRSKSIDLIEKTTLIGQVSGSTEFTLLPRNNCENYCKLLNVTLSKGESLLLTTMWNLKYTPVGNGENIAVILEIH